MSLTLRGIYTCHLDTGRGFKESSDVTEVAFMGCCPTVGHRISRPRKARDNFSKKADDRKRERPREGPPQWGGDRRMLKLSSLKWVGGQREAEGLDGVVRIRE